VAPGRARRKHQEHDAGLLEWLYDQGLTVFCTKYVQRGWHQLLGSGVYADAIMGRIVHNAIWVETGGYNSRERTAGQVTA
jgi:hypothetical protein